MTDRRLLPFVLAAAVLAASGCTGTAPRGKVRIMSAVGPAGAPVQAAGVVSTNGAGVVQNNTAGVVSTNGAGIVSTNGAALTGVVRGPSAAALANHAAGVLAAGAAGLVGNNAGALVANNAAGVVANNTAGLVGNNSSGVVAKGGGLYALAHAGHAAPPATPRRLEDEGHAPRPAAFEPVGGALVEALDLAGKIVSRKPVRTGPDGSFTFPPGGLGPSNGPLIFRAVVAVGTRTVTLEALVPAGAAASAPIAMTPASTLVAKKARALVAAGRFADQPLGVEAAARLAEALAPFMSERAAVAAVLVEDAVAGQVLDAMAGASPELADELEGASEASTGDALLAPAPPPPGGTTSGTTAEAPPPRRNGGGNNNNDDDDDAPPPAAPTADAGAAITSEDAWVATRLVGDGTHGSANGAALAATVGEIGGVAVGPDGSVYFTDVDHHQIRRRLPGGTTELLAGQPDEGPGYAGDGQPATQARFTFPLGLAFDGERDVLVVADHDNNRIRAFAPGGRISTLVGGGGDGSEDVADAHDAALDGPAGVALDPNGWLFFTEHNRVRRMSPAGEITMLAGIGNGGGHWPIAADAGRQLVWYGDGTKVFAITASRGAAEAHAVPVFTATGAGVATPRIAGLATDGRGRLYVLQVAEDGGQPRDVRIFRLLTDATGFLRAGRSAEAIAGTGGLGAAEADYLVPAVGIANALEQLLPGIGGCNLAIDLNKADDVSDLAGQLYLGGSAEFGGETGGQVIRLAPPDTGPTAL